MELDCSVISANQITSDDDNEALYEMEAIELKIEKNVMQQSNRQLGYSLPSFENNTLKLRDRNKFDRKVGSTGSAKRRNDHGVGTTDCDLDSISGSKVDSRPKQQLQPILSYALLSLLVFLSTTIGLVVFTSQPNNEISTLRNSQTRHMTDRSASIQAVVGRLVGSEHLTDASSPYTKALEWIAIHDPLQLPATEKNLVQRFILAYYYYATSADMPWTACNPPEYGQDDACLVVTKIPSDPLNLENILPRSTTSTTYAIRWLTGRDECLWMGVYCDKMSNVIRVEHLPYVLNMTGSFPSGIKNLPFMQELSLSEGIIGSTLPDTTFEVMKHFVDLKVPQNELTGTIPASLWQVRTLHNMVITNNNIHGNISTETMQLSEDLKILDLSNNMLTGTLTSYLGQLSQLEILNLANNSFSGVIPTEIFALTRLAELNLQSCNLTGTISPLFENLESINVIELQGNNFFGEVPSELGNLVGLKKLLLQGNDLSGSVPSQLCDTTQFLAADCLQSEDGEVKISCAQDCCTTCCNDNGEYCVEN